MTHLARARVLVVDDRPDIRLSLLFMLEAMGFGVAEAWDGQQALKCLAKEQIDVVIADLHMPGVDGLALITEIVKKGSHRPRLIAMTGSEVAGSPTLDAAMAAGTDAVLSKPFTRHELLEAIRGPHERRRWPR